MKKVIIFVAIMVFACSAYSDGFKSEEEVREYADKLMDQFIKKDFKSGLDDAKKYWPIPAVEIDGMTNKIIQQWPIVDQRFGEAISKEFVKEERIGKSFLRYYYLHKFDNHSIYWQIDFYKPHKEWKINTIIFLDNLDPLYE
jgi:hypothetical protein